MCYHFAWPKDLGLYARLLSRRKRTAPSPEDPRSALRQTPPALESVSHSRRPSASSYPACGNRRGTPRHYRTTPRRARPTRCTPHSTTARETLVARLWLAGHGRFEVSRSARRSECTLIDASGWATPSGSTSAGGAHPASRRSHSIPAASSVFFNGHGAPIDTCHTRSPSFHVEDKSRLCRDQGHAAS